MENLENLTRKILPQILQKKLLRGIYKIIVLSVHYTVYTLR